MNRIKLNPWASELDWIVPNRPEDFSHFVHFCEGMRDAYLHFLKYCEAQKTHDRDDLIRAGKAVQDLASTVREVWEAYKGTTGVRRY